MVHIGLSVIPKKACHRTLRDQLQLPGNSQMPKMECLPLYAALSPQQQMRIWDSPKPGKRRVILSTNIGKSFHQFIWYFDETD